MTWADEIGSWEDCLDEGEKARLLAPPGISDRSYIRGDSIRSMPTPSRAIFVWRPSGWESSRRLTLFFFWNCPS